MTLIGPPHRGQRHRAAATETFSRCPAFSLISGGWPFGAQLRRTSGAINSPLSSSSTRYAPRRRAFFRPRLELRKNEKLRNAKEDEGRADNAFMHQQDIQSIVDAAHETADAIIGAREWKTAEDASDMRDVIFWDLLAKQLPQMTVAQIVSELDRSLK